MELSSEGRGHDYMEEIEEEGVNGLALKKGAPGNWVEICYACF